MSDIDPADRSGGAGGPRHEDLLTAYRSALPDAVLTPTQRWTIPPLHGFPTAPMKTVAVDADGRVWAATKGLVFLFDGSAWQPHEGTDELPSSQGAVVDQQGRIWTGNPGTVGVTVSDGHDERTYTTADGLPHDKITEVAVGGDGTVWAATAAGVAAFDGHTWRTYTCNDGLPPSAVDRLAVGDDGRVWATTPQRMIAVFDGHTWRTYAGAEDLPNDHPLRHTVKNGRWVEYRPSRTLNMKIDVFDGHTWTTYKVTDVLPGQKADWLGVTRDGQLWAETDREFRVFDGHTWTSYSKDADNPRGLTLRFRDVAVDRDGRVWAARFRGSGFVMFDGHTWAYGPSTYSSENVVGVLDDGRAWGGSAKALYVFDGRTWESYDQDDGLPGLPVNDMAVGRDGTLWAATAAGPAILQGFDTVEQVRAGHRRPWLWSGADTREHVEARAHGRLVGWEPALGDLFRGREQALQIIADWLAEEQDPQKVLVVTGGPGTGTSALLARAALTAYHSHPGTGFFFDAHSATAADFERERRRSSARPRSQPERPQAVFVDSLDEAASMSEARLIARNLRTMGKRVVVVIGAPGGSERRSGPALLEAFGFSDDTAEIGIDLDEPVHAHPPVLEAFVHAVLTQQDNARPSPPDGSWRSYRADDALRSRLAKQICNQAAGSFLLAGLVAHLLSQDPHTIDPAASGFDPTRLPSSLGQVTGRFVDKLPAEQREPARALLGALAFAGGPGFPDRLWLASAAALGCPDIEQADLDQLRDGEVAELLLSSSDSGERVTRLCHRALIDHLLEEQPLDQRRAVYQALREQVDLDGGWSSAPDHLRLHATDYATTAGLLPTLIEDIDFLPNADGDALVAVVEHDPHTQQTPLGATIMTCANRVRQLTGQERVSVLHQTAALLGFDGLRDKLGRHLQPHPLSLRWFHGPEAGHRRLYFGNHYLDVVSGRLPDGRQAIASGCVDGVLRLFDSANGEELGQHSWTDSAAERKRRAITAVAWGTLADGRDVIAFGYNGAKGSAVGVWDLSDGDPLGPLPDGRYDEVEGLAMGTLPDGRSAIVVGGDGNTTLWDPVGGGPMGRLATDEVHAIVWATLPDGSILLVTGEDNGTLQFWDPSTAGETQDPAQEHSLRLRLPHPDVRQTHSEVCSLALGKLPDGRYLLAAGCDNGTVQLWDPRDRELIGKPFQAHRGSVEALTFGTLPDGSYVLATGGYDAMLRLWDPDLRTQIAAPLPLVGIPAALHHTDAGFAVAAGMSLLMYGGADEHD